MSLHFYFGGTGSGKTRRLLTTFIQESMREPRKRFLIVVPEQSTMETQRELVSLHPRKGILNIEVLSISRLAYRVFAETGFRRESMLEEIGKTFLLEKVALEKRDEFRWFGKTLQRPDHLAEMKAMVSEFMLYGVSPDVLVSRDLPEESPLTRKLGDLSLILDAFLEKLREKHHMTAEEIPERLAELAGQSELLRGSVIGFDGFTGFTPLQMHLLENLMRAAGEFHLTCAVDADQNPFEKPGSDDLFAMSCEMAQGILHLAGKTGTEVAKPVYLASSSLTRHGASPALAHLAANIFRPVRPEEDRIYRGGQGGAVRIYAARDPREETTFIAREICRLVRTEGLRYRDIAVVTGDLEAYGNLARQIFPANGIPCFIDEKRSLILNPFMEYLRAALECVSEDYSISGMFRMLKSGMTDLDEEMIWRLENYAMAAGVRGKKRWRQPFIHHYRGEDQGELPALNAVREEILALIDPLADAFASRGSTVLEKTTALYEFCVRSRAGEKLRAREEYFKETGRADLAREYAQVYPYVIQFLDKLVSALGDERISMRDYRALLEAGFAEARVAIIPPGNDQVRVCDMERSRISGVKVLFFAGVNEGKIPRPPKEGGILTQSDRNTLGDAGISLRPAAREQLSISRFYLYLTLAKPSEKLVFSYSVTDSSGGVQRPASLIHTVCSMFPDLRAENRPKELTGLVERPEMGIALVAEGLREIGIKPFEPAYLELFSYFSHHPLYQERIHHLLRAAGVKKQDDPISADAVRILYGDTVAGSASRLELFFGCEFAHFLSYGLRLKERPEYTFTGLDLGSILHASLEYIARAAGLRKVTWEDLASGGEKVSEITKESIREALGRSGSALLYDGARNRYEIRRMERLLGTTAWAVGKQISAGDFTSFQAEAAFREMLSDVWTEMPLQGGMRMLLTGRIDRVDLSEDGAVTYVGVTDYKTGAKTFDLVSVYHGLQMQLLLYLRSAMEAVRARGGNPVPAGVMYYRVQDPVVKYIRDESSEDTDSRILRELKGSGFFLKDRTALAHYDRALAAGNKSDVIPVEFKKDGDYKAASKVLTEEEFAMLIGRTMRNAARAGHLIAGGSVRINPYEYKQETACTYCPYRSVCGFDEKIPGYGYRKITEMDQETLFLKMEEESDELDH